MTPETEPEADVLITDGAAMVNSLLPPPSRTFEVHITKYKGTDIVFDVYLSLSLKAETRSK